ncbi:conserved hypothetical protein [Desulfonatronospira thiodismutans ASO3-1]|uniref:ThiamineS protein n=1 Tax=Desulfonatronospira thiodismutans ASO3-1 TaxID=555779 RepID=D6SS78_9BACT|nr:MULTISPECIES: hypothetical protein [Desulfonatronospira]EFI33544.1 conserved hypothetical protein [Desulfonatronospira thiodismutans ASO3-1]RQD73453.1 MAG: hypothetical protein D5S03_12665 [Desulfonatronospira sp. MSAO_Bac3]
MQILIEPENQWADIDRATTVLNLLKKLELRPNQAIVIRNGELLTPDRQIDPEDSITVRKTASRG